MKQKEEETLNVGYVHCEGAKKMDIKSISGTTGLLHENISVL